MIDTLIRDTTVIGLPKYTLIHTNTFYKIEKSARQDETFILSISVTKSLLLSTLVSLTNQLDVDKHFYN